MAIVVVRCDEQERPVFIDQQHQGTTDQELSVPEDSHVFDLGGSGDYEPSFKEIFISNTVPQPILVVFNPLLALATRPPVTSAPRAEKAARKRAPARKKTAKRKAARARTSTKKSSKTRATRPAKKTSAKRKAARGKK